MRIKVGRKPIPASFLKIEGRGTLVGVKDRKGLVSVQNQGPVAPPMGKRRGGKGDVRRGATARRAMEKGGCVRVIEGEEV